MAREAHGVEPRDRLILALDVGSAEEARQVVEELGDSVCFYKLGLALFMSPGYFELIDWLAARDKKVFADLKFFDIPQTVRSAVRHLARHEVAFATVHAGNDRMLEAACEAKGDRLEVLAVTVLTSLSREDLDDLGFQVDVPSLVLSRAERAIRAGCDGVVASGEEGRRLRDRLGSRFLIVMPGIRPVWNDVVRGDDQKRVVGVKEAFENGADYIVVGRPILQAPDPRAQAERFQEEIRQTLT